MIRKVRFNNFYSFNGEQEISFLANKKETYDYFQSANSDQITKIAGFIGGNASGKTNVMRFFSFLAYFVCRNVNDKTPFLSEFVYKTFFNKSEPSKFYIEFERDGALYFYNFSIQRDKILDETLSFKKLQKRARIKEVFSRHLNTINHLENDVFKNITIESLPKIRDDISFITFMKRSAYSVDIINSIYDYFSHFQTNIDEKGETYNLYHQFVTIDDYSSDEDLKKITDNFLHDFDIGLERFEVEKTTRGNKRRVDIKGIHITDSGEKALPFDYESNGTRSLFYAIMRIEKALKNNSIAVLDELEFGMHPEALSKILSYFISENKEGRAQLIFSSHSFDFLNRFDMHQIYLVQKNQKCESSVVRLNEVEGIRSDDNFFAKYMTGAYGAFPKIRI